jgi:hypothetical protein
MEGRQAQEWLEQQCLPVVQQVNKAPILLCLALMPALVKSLHKFNRILSQSLKK